MSTELLLAMGGMALTLVTTVGGAFYFTGRVVRSIELLTQTATDHENRIRVLELAPATKE